MSVHHSILVLWPMLNLSCPAVVAPLVIVYVLFIYCSGGGGVLNLRTVDLLQLKESDMDENPSIYLSKYSSYCCNLKSCQGITWQKKK